MEVKLAGFNVDTSVLHELEKKTETRNDITPEVLSASYARISRDPRSIDEIRKDARKEIEKTRQSNSSIIFKMGHHSVAEHAVFNFDIVGLSRYAVEKLEKFRLCSYTEKSQRYITLDNDFVIPEEIIGTKLEDGFIATIKLQNEAYLKFFEVLRSDIFERNSFLANNPAKHSLLEDRAKEDARYIVSLATKTQLGMTVNARNLELMLRRFASHHLSEIRKLGDLLYREVKKVAPSIILFYEENDYDKNTYSRLQEQIMKLSDSCRDKTPNEAVSLINCPEDGDDIIASALVYKGSDNHYYYPAIESFLFHHMKDIQKIFKAVWEDAQFYDAMPREFELVNLTYQLILSSTCYAQLKRHRMSTIITKPYELSLGRTIPQSIIDVGLREYFDNMIKITGDFYRKIQWEFPLIAPYILTNSHRRSVLMHINARELYHISRLREDNHAQWDIRKLVGEMCSIAKEKMPLTFKLLGGKDMYKEIYYSVFKKYPKIIEQKLPEK